MGTHFKHPIHTFHRACLSSSDTDHCRESNLPVGGAVVKSIIYPTTPHAHSFVTVVEAGYMGTSKLGANKSAFMGGFYGPGFWATQN